MPHIRPHAVMKLSLRTAFLAAKSALAFNAWFFYYTRSTSKTRLHQMALSAWKATAQQSLSNSAIQSSVKVMQKRRGRKKGHGRRKRREIVVSAAEANIPPACKHPSFPLLKVKQFFPPLFCNVLWGGGVRNSTCKLVTKQHSHIFSTGRFFASLADHNVNDRLIIFRFWKTQTPMLPPDETSVSILDKGLLFFCDIFLTWLSFPPHTVDDQTANCALYWRPATSTIQIQSELRCDVGSW